MFQSWQLKKKPNLQVAPKMGISSSHVMQLTIQKKRKRKRERKEKKLNAEKRKAKNQLKKNKRFAICTFLLIFNFFYQTKFVIAINAAV